MRKFTVCVLSCFGAAFLLSGCNSKSESTTASVGVAPPSKGAPAAPTPMGWSLDVKSLTPPDNPVAGRVGGQDFRPDKVELDGDTLTFRQGKDFFADREIKLMMFGGDSLEGFKLEVAPEQGFGTSAPHIHASWKKGGGDQLPASEFHLNKYALKLEFGKIEAGKLPGKIYLCLPDAAKSFLAGSFSVSAEGLGTGNIHGSIAFKGEPQKQYKLTTGYFGRDVKGKDVSGFAGSTVAKGIGGYVQSAGSRLESKMEGDCIFKHVRVPPGFYFVFVAWDNHYVDWRWVELKQGEDAAVDLAVDPGLRGNLEVSLPAGSKDRRVQLIPLDAQGRLPEKAGPLDHLAMLMGNGGVLRAEAPAGKDSVNFTGVKAGHYRAVAGKATVDVEVKAKGTAKAELKAK